MARKRYIKPGFFKNEELASLPPLVRILFEGLWCYADREGRLEDRPLRLKSDIIPYDNLNVESALNKLQDKNFIIRYKFSEGKTENRFIQIINFKKHQDVHVNEQSSTIPAPVLHCASTVELQNKNGGSTPLNLELNTLNLIEEVVVESAREIEIQEAIEEFTFDAAVELHHEQQKKLREEKNSAKKEKTPLPTTDEMIDKIIASTTCHWWNAIQFYLAKGVKWDKITEVERQVYYDHRKELFEKFYASKQDNYNIRLPTCTDIAQNFYNWIPTELNREKAQALNGYAISKSLTHTQPAKAVVAQSSNDNFMNKRGHGTGTNDY